MIVAIDGPAAAGKGTLAKNVAKHFNFAYLDTGSLYRAVGLTVLNQGGDPSDEKIATKVAEEFEVKDIFAIMNNPEIRNERAGSAASKVSVIPAVRKALFDFQRNFAENPILENGQKAKGSVLDGRDIGTVVCPDADVKLFVTASTEVRAKRRYLEQKEKGLDVTLEATIADMKIRDERDSSRSTAPLKPADDAVILDTSEMSIDEVFGIAVKMVEKNQ